MCLNFELMDSNLYEVLSRKNAVMSEDKCKLLLRQIFSGLEYIHG